MHKQITNLEELKGWVQEHLNHTHRIKIESLEWNEWYRGWDAAYFNVMNAINELIENQKGEIK